MMTMMMMMMMMSSGRFQGLSPLAGAIGEPGPRCSGNSDRTQLLTLLGCDDLAPELQGKVQWGGDTPPERTV